MNIESCYFTLKNPQLPNIKYGNWGSRPFEYHWAASSLLKEFGADGLTKTKIIDLGTGLPSEHTWNQFVRTNFHPALYVGIDNDARMKEEEINQEQHKMLWMDMTNLKYPDETFDVVLCLSTYEHLPTTEIFDKSMLETKRVLKKNGLLLVTLDEMWDTSIKDSDCICNTWNDFERALLESGRFVRKNDDWGDPISFGINDFAGLVKEHFVPMTELIDKTNASNDVLHSYEYNSTVSFASFRKK